VFPPVIQESEVILSPVFTPLRLSSTIDDVLKHPAFAGFSRFLLPLEQGYSGDMPLQDISTLLPFHRNVNPQQSVEILNAMMGMVADGIASHNVSQKMRHCYSERVPQGWYPFCTSLRYLGTNM